MDHEPKPGPTDPRRPSDRPIERELFCIHSYAGESGPPCGWRGPAADTLRETKTGARRCPRCGRTTLLEIPRL